MPAGDGEACRRGRRLSSMSPTGSWRGSSPKNVGKPLACARAEIEMVAPVLHFYAGAVDKHDGGTMPIAAASKGDSARRSASSPDYPSDFPLNMHSLKLGPRSSTATPLSSGRRNCQS
jgi:hypothetical protein